MGLKDWLAKRSEDTADTAWTSEARADESFERWVAQQGTDFLPPDTSGWPVAEWGPTLRDAYMNGEPIAFENIYKTQPAVYTCVQFLSWQISQLNIKSYDRVSDEERVHVQDSPVAQTIRNPAPGLTYARLMGGTVSDVCVFGNAYWLLLEVPKADKYTPSGWSIVPLAGPYVTPLGGNILEPNEYKFSMGGEERTFPAERVCHFRLYNPSDRRIGVSPLLPLASTLAEDREASRYAKSLWKNNARISGFIKRPIEANPMDSDSRKHFRAGLQKFGRGGVNEGSWMLLEDGETPIPMTFSSRESEYTDGRKFSLETVCRAYNIPLAVLSLTESVAYASQKELHLQLYRDTLPPWTRLFEDEIDLKLSPLLLGSQNTTQYVEFNLEEKLRGAFEEQAAMLQSAVGGPYMTRNEARARLNLPRIEDPDADELVVTNNMVGTENGEEGVVPNAPVVQLAPNSPQEGTQP